MTKPSLPANLGYYLRFVCFTFSTPEFHLPPIRNIDIAFLVAYACLLGTMQVSNDAI